MNEFIKSLPIPCQTIQIKPRHKIALEHFQVLNDIWVVLLTLMPGDSSKAWRLTKKEYWTLQPKHGTRDRFIRENYTPTIQAAANPAKPVQTSLF